jgi:hypothetical protein
VDISSDGGSRALAVAAPVFLLAFGVEMDQLDRPKVIKA